MRSAARSIRAGLAGISLVTSVCTTLPAPSPSGESSATLQASPPTDCRVPSCQLRGPAENHTRDPLPRPSRLSCFHCLALAAGAVVMVVGRQPDSSTAVRTAKVAAGPLRTIRRGSGRTMLIKIGREVCCRPNQPAAGARLRPARFSTAEKSIFPANVRLRNCNRSSRQPEQPIRFPGSTAAKRFFDIWAAMPSPTAMGGSLRLVRASKGCAPAPLPANLPAEHSHQLLANNRAPAPGALGEARHAFNLDSSAASSAAAARANSMLPSHSNTSSTLQIPTRTRRRP